jgi:SanA protein
MKRIIFIVIAFFIFLIILGVVANHAVVTKSKSLIYSNVDSIPSCYTAIVLGAHVTDSGYPSDFLKDRLDVAIELYKKNKVKRFLLTGDHGKLKYDEVNNMKKYLIENHINTADIFLDHAGFDTYNSMVRAKDIFEVKDAIIVTQEFHLPRALYIAVNKGLKVYGIKADRRQYSSIKRLNIREKIAIIKAFFEVSINRKPKFLGEKIPITGNSNLSYD